MGRWSHLRAGYANWGPVRKPLPRYTVLTDRVTGARWAVEHDEGVGAPLLVAFNERRHVDRAEYGPHDGPRAEGNGNYKLVVDSGSLSFELDPLPIAEGQGKHQVGRGSAIQPRILTRRGFQRRSLHVDVGQFGQLEYEEVDV